MRTRLALGIALSLAIGGCARRARAHAPALRWENPRPTGATLRASCVAADGTLWVAGHVGALLSRSPRGRFTPVALEAEDDLHALACCPDGRVVAVGDRGLVVTVERGVARVERRGPHPLHAVACGPDGTLAASSSGSALHTRGPGEPWLESRAPAQLVSLWTDGERWLAGGADGAVYLARARPVAFAQTASASARPVLAFASAGGKLVGVGPFGTVVRSDDGGAHWRAIDAGTREDLLTVRADGAGFRAAGTGGAALTSADGERWTREDGALPSRVFSLARQGDRWLAMGDAGALSTLEPGGRWRAEDSERASLFGAYADRSLRIAVGRAGTLLVQRGESAPWTPQRTGVEYDLRAVTSDGRGTFLIVGDHGTVLRSTDGARTFAPVDLGRTEALYQVFLDARGHAVAVGPGLCARSSDGGQRWVLSALPQRLSVGALAFDGEWLWMAGDRGFVRRTRDFGLYWEDVTLPRPVDVQRIVPRGRGRVALFSKQAVVLEREGARWVERPAPAEVIFAARATPAGVLATSFGGGVYMGSGSPLRWRPVRRLTRDSVFDIAVSPTGAAWLVGEWGTILSYR
jgi:photosystem II stability/assembly factor-like uncharacterized protein